jgi:hypothetical protein
VHTTDILNLLKLKIPAMIPAKVRMTSTPFRTEKIPMLVKPVIIITKSIAIEEKMPDDSNKDPVKRPIMAVTIIKMNNRKMALVNLLFLKSIPILNGFMFIMPSFKLTVGC